MPTYPYTITDFLKGRIHILRQPSPILRFYELKLPDGAFYRVVDFFDARAGGSLPNKIPFNGVEFTATPFNVSDREEDVEGGTDQFTVSIEDVFHVGAALLWQFDGLDGCVVNEWICPYDGIGDVGNAQFQSYEVVSSSISEGPDLLVLTVGEYNIVERIFPKEFYDRNRCPNEYVNRFIPGNRCSYPSNEFDEKRTQDYLVGGDEKVQQRKYGWWTQRAVRTGLFRVGPPGVSAGGLGIVSDTAFIRWESEDRYGPNIFRPITGDFDVHTLVSSLLQARTKWMAGFCIQDEADAVSFPGENPPVTPDSSWLLWGMTDNTTGGRQLFVRSTETNVSSSAVYAFTDLYLRVKRTGVTYELFSKNTEAEPWTLRASIVNDVLGAVPVNRVGLFIGSDNIVGTDTVGAVFEYIRFTAGGLPACLQVFSDCVLHDNTVDFNGFQGIPDEKPTVENEEPPGEE